ncbi:MAG: V-type ATPase subunit [Ruminococcus sp.]|nr:V-type ATPase subunit [Ruminococcus sp.]
MSDTSFAVLTKARAKFGKRLTDKDYTNLLACNSVTEIMTYLKSYTHYSTILRDVNERDVHRGRLEVLLKQQTFNDFDSLCRYDSSISSGFSGYIVNKTEIEQIIRFLTLLNSDSTEKFIFQFPAFFSKHTLIDIPRLALARNYHEFLAVLKNTEYYHILSKFKPDSLGRLPVSDIENKLLSYILKKFETVVNKKTKGSEKEELTELFSTINDFNNFTRILRLKKYYDLSAEDIRDNLITTFSKLNEKTIEKMCEAESSSEIFSIMESTCEGKIIEKIGYVYASDISPRVKYKLARKNLRFSNHPSVVMISYVFFAEIELMNIITLIEGKRYKLGSKKIQSMLIL